MNVRLTKLQAINRILRGASEAPLSSEDAVPTNESLFAEDVLNEMDLQFQMQGLHENMVVRELPPFFEDEEDEAGPIFVPENVITVDTWGCDIHRNVKVVEVDGQFRLYNMDDHTDQWKHPVTVRIVERVPFEELPAPVQFSIVDAAARVYQNQVQGDDMADRLLREVQLVSRAIGKAHDIRTKRKNSFIHGRANGPRFGGRFVRRWWR